MTTLKTAVNRGPVKQTSGHGLTVAYPVFPHFLTRSIYDLSSQRISYC